jgi:hypothetical protein
MQRAVKTLLSLALLVALVGVGFLGWQWYRKEGEKDRTIEEQKRIIAALEQKLDRAWAEELVADMRVNSLSKSAAGEPQMNLTFAQYAPGTEKPVLTKTMTIPGQEFYVDAFVAKFERKLVEEGDGLRGKSLLVFRRVFGDRQKPIDGVPLYRQSNEVDLVVPEQLQVDTKPSPFELQLWSKFWTYANDPKAAAEAGVRVAQGEAPHVKAVSGQVYKIVLRASGGLEITPRLPAAMVGGAEVAPSASGSAP